MFLKNKNIIFKIRRSKVTDYAALTKRLVKPRVLKSFRMNSFSIRAIDKWNNLTDDIVNSSTVLSFKTMYDRYMGDQEYHTGDIY